MLIAQAHPVPWLGCPSRGYMAQLSSLSPSRKTKRKSLVAAYKITWIWMFLDFLACPAHLGVTVWNASSPQWEARSWQYFHSVEPRIQSRILALVMLAGADILLPYLLEQGFRERRVTARTGRMGPTIRAPHSNGQHDQETTSALSFRSLAGRLLQF